ncbi:uncharacterized protein LOC134234579 [Saccostrea cucullata]|uniref:uncharacterized protein LOC134234579 n=1 Tax=Saccostrea cuccullata TaxID=36930 RepID=UPI002ED17457
MESAIQRISESVFLGLCLKVGTSKVVAMRRDMMGINDMVENKTTIDGFCVMLSGSQGEGFRLKESDLDSMIWPKNQRVIWELSQSQYYNTHRQTLFLCDYSDSPPGFTLLYLLSPSMDRFLRSVCVTMYNRYYISSSKLRHIMCPTSSNYILHGPCSNGTFGMLEYDHAFCFVCDFWPPSASSWIDRCHSWPQPDVVGDIVQSGCHFVAIGHKLGNHEDHEWRISFSLAEQRLINSMNHCQFLTYGLLKLFFTEIINKGLNDDDKLLCSYHTKTAVFWAIQQNTIPHWCPQNLLGGFWVCFKLILKWVYEGVCPNFFIPENNMFLSKMHGDKQHHLITRLYGLYEKGLTCLLHSPSIRSHIINVLQNPRISICTDEQTLISKAWFDRFLYNEIARNEAVYFNSNVQSCMRYLHTIKQMIELPLLTQFQVIMLQKIASLVFCKTAFTLHMETNMFENKLRYRTDKISCHMLKLVARFGFITDMQYIAMYYYKTLRYMNALSIIEMIKVKLAQPYVLYRSNEDTEIYTEAVGGQSWSTKMRQAVAWHITLDDRIHYISELIPEQQASLQNKTCALTFPPFILLYMLEILCYLHVDIMKTQTVLDDLQTLVQYDEGQIIDLNYRDISWQILGICQQVTGNLHAALYSYQQSLRQEPYHKIRTATKMRIQGICQWNPSII